MKTINKIQEFCKALIKTGSGISSNRFLGVFIFSPVLIIAVFTGIDANIIYTISGLILALLGANALAKHKNFKQNNDEIG